MCPFNISFSSTWWSCCYCRNRWWEETGNDLFQVHWWDERDGPTDSKGSNSSITLVCHVVARAWILWKWQQHYTSPWAKWSSRPRWGQTVFYSVICSHVEAVVAKWLIVVVQVQAFTLGCFLGQETLLHFVFSPTLLGELIIIFLKRVEGGHTTNRGLSPVPVMPVIGSSWPYTSFSCFNCKGMVSIHNIHLINQYYSNMFAVFIVSRHQFYYNT